jgi:hypothetical protein
VWRSKVDYGEAAYSGSQVFPLAIGRDAVMSYFALLGGHASKRVASAYSGMEP